MPQPLTLSSQRPGAAGGTSSAIGRREACLRAEYAKRYPGIRVGIWESAAVIADRVLAEGLLRGVPVGWRDRVLSDGHFEFRGSGTQETERPRREDR